MSANLHLFPMSSSIERFNGMIGSAPSQPSILSLPIPLPAVLILASIGYMSIVVLVFLLYNKFHPKKKHRGGILKSQSFDCCTSAVDICNCCNAISIDECLSGICPQRKSYDWADLILCQVCVGGHKKVLGPPMVECPVCCRSIYCEDTTVCCFYCNFRERPIITNEL